MGGAHIGFICTFRFIALLTLPSSLVSILSGRHRDYFLSCLLSPRSPCIYIEKLPIFLHPSPPSTTPVAHRGKGGLSGEGGGRRHSAESIFASRGLDSRLRAKSHVLLNPSISSVTLALFSFRGSRSDIQEKDYPSGVFPRPPPSPRPFPSPAHFCENAGRASRRRGLIE